MGNKESLFHELNEKLRANIQESESVQLVKTRVKEAIDKATDNNRKMEARTMTAGELVSNMRNDGAKNKQQVFVVSASDPRRNIPINGILVDEGWVTIYID